jgi:hypothetical protein
MDDIHRRSLSRDRQCEEPSAGQCREGSGGLDHRRRGDDRAQASYLKTLSEEAGEEFDDGLTKAEASKKIDALQEKTGRGIDH